MENRLQATFMPRQSPVPGVSSSRPKAPTNFLMMIGVLILVLVLGGMGALYAYKLFITSSNEKKQAQIQEEIKNFEPELTRDLTILKARVDAGKILLDNHRAFSLLFSLLELNTAKTVQFKEFSYTVSPDKTIKLTMKGEARSYNAVAYQSDIFSKVEQLKNPMFTNIDLSESGSVMFSFTADLDPSTVLYKKLVSATSVSANASGTASASSTPSSNNSASSTSSTSGTTTPSNRTNQPGS
jgi:hypothetical protein